MLIHRGLSAYSGHYVAHIKDRKVNIVLKHNVLKFSLHVFLRMILKSSLNMSHFVQFAIKLEQYVNNLLSKYN